MSNEECVICKESYDDQRLPFELECRHIFCKCCILDTFKRDSRCPLCRKEYELIVKPKTEVDDIHIIPPQVRELLRRLPIGGNSQDIIDRVEYIFYRTCVNVDRIVTIIYQPSCKFILNDQCRLELNIHSAVVIFLTMLLWTIMCYFK